MAQVFIPPDPHSLCPAKFVDEEEWSQARGASNVRFLDLVRKLTAEEPSAMLLQVGGMWQGALNAAGAQQDKAHGGSDPATLPHLEVWSSKIPRNHD